MRRLPFVSRALAFGFCALLAPHASAAPVQNEWDDPKPQAQLSSEAARDACFLISGAVASADASRIEAADFNWDSPGLDLSMRPSLIKQYPPAPPVVPAAIAIASVSKGRF